MPIARDTVDRLFLDMNAFFASVEQHRQPRLRGRPVAVVPTMTDRTCCIAVSYEARRYGVRTGTNVGEARRMCPGIELVHGNHEHYIGVHEQIKRAVETVLPIDRVCSIDEMVCPLAPEDRSPRRAQEVARRVKQAIANHVGPALRCSVGLAPNRFLAKVASNLQKPDGLSLILPSQLPRRLYPLKLTDLPDIGARMEKRLRARGVTSVRRLCALSRRDMHDLWCSIVGEHYWMRLRGEEPPEKETHRRTLGHSHMLAPELRTDEGAWAVLVRLLHKAAARMRKEGCVARHLQVSVRYVGGSPRMNARLPVGRVDDTPTLLAAMAEAWRDRPAWGTPLKASVTLLGLEPASQVTRSLFDEDTRAADASRAMDGVNRRVGPNSVYFAAMHTTRNSAPVRVAFSHIPDIETESTGDDLRSEPLAS